MKPLKVTPERTSRGWIGVDFDGTLATYNGWQGVDHVGNPVPAMMARVRAWLAEGREVRIVTARVSRQGAEGRRAAIVVRAWLLRHLGQLLPIVASKDFNMIELWDDRCVQVETNTGRRMDGKED